MLNGMYDSYFTIKTNGCGERWTSQGHFYILIFFFKFNLVFYKGGGVYDVYIQEVFLKKQTKLTNDNWHEKSQRWGK